MCVCLCVSYETHMQVRLVMSVMPQRLMQMM